MRAPSSGYDLHPTIIKKLFLRVSSSEARAWEVFYRLLGKRQRVTIGPITAVSFLEAQERTAEILAMAESGQSPRAQNNQSGRGTVSDLLDDFDRRHLQRNDIHPTIRARIERWIRPALGDMELKEVNAGSFLRLAQSIEQAGAQAEHYRILKICWQIWGWGAERGWVSQANPVPILRAPVSRRTRYLSGEEIAILWRDAARVDDSGQCPLCPRHRLAWQLAVLTGQRIGSILSARREHFDLSRAIWTIPARDMKRGGLSDQGHVVHLSALAVGLLEPFVDGQVCGWMFPGERRMDAPVSSSLFGARHRKWLASLGIEAATVHDYRRAFATHCASLSIAPHVAEKILAHRMGGIMAVYNRAEYLDERKAALEAYSQWVARLAEMRPEPVGLAWLDGVTDRILWHNPMP